MHEWLSPFKSVLNHFLRRQIVWFPTWKGWLLIGLGGVFLLSFLLSQIHPYLSPQSRLKAEVLIVEGWIPDYALKQAISEFQQGSYQMLVTTGSPLPKGYYLSGYKTTAALAAETLLKLGFKAEQLVAVPAPDVLKDRTETAAQAVKAWRAEYPFRSANLYSLGVHSRRSWILYQRVLSPPVSLGIIAADPQEYDAKRWWVSSEGVRTVISEAIGFLYVCLFR